jgi:two-component system sensor histidine kinase PilS (NtrC family)
MNHRLLIQSTRLGIYLIVVVLTVLNHFLQDNFFNWSLFYSFYGIASLGLLIHLLPLIQLDAFFEKRPLIFVTFAVDIILISLLMLTSGLNQTLFLFMYLVTIILVGLVFQMRGSLLIAAFASIGFTVASWFGPEIKAMSFLFILILNNLSFFVVAGLSGYLSDQLNLFAQKIQAQSLSLQVIRRLNEMIIETIPSALFTVNNASEILQFNPGAAKLFQNQKLEGVRLFELVPELAKRVPHLESLKFGEKHEVQWAHSSEPSLLSVNLLPQVSTFEIPTFLVVIEDLTEIRRLEFAVRQSEKMAAVGQLAAGIAHEIRNPLAGISGSVELLSQNFTDADDKKLGRIILKEIDRLNRLISEFLDFAKPEKPPGELIDLNSILRDVIQNANSSQSQPIEIQAQFTDHAEILGHKDKLKQAFLNIVINGVQAMDQTQNPVLTVSSMIEKDRVVVRIKDQGCGISAETQKRMFEPFHTTKPKGTGLGLAITHKILEAHSAQIHVESQQGLGTEFVISFPAKSFENQRPTAENKL